MIIDMRCRPPFGGFLDPELCDLYIDDNIKSFSARFGKEPGRCIASKTMETFIQEMDDAGVDKAVVPLRFSPGGLGTESSAELHMENDDLVKLAEQYGDRVITVAGMNLSNIDQALTDIDKYVLNGPCLGAVLEPGYNPEPMFADDERLFPIYEKCEKNNIPVMLSFGGMTAPNYEYNRPIYIQHVADVFPKLKMSLGHAAWPWVTEVCYVAFRNENVYISPDIYLMNVPGSADYVAACNQWIPEKILYGSAYPVINLKDAIAVHRNAIKEDYIDGILGGNAMRFWGIEA